MTSYEAAQANLGISDEQVLAYATSKNRSVITLNRDDFIFLHRSGVHHCGIVICKDDKDDRDYVGQAQALHHYLGIELKNLQNSLIRVQKQNQPKSAGQIFIIREYTR